MGATSVPVTSVAAGVAAELKRATAAGARPEWDFLGRVADQVARRISRLGSGPLAELRRTDVAHWGTAAFARLVGAGGLVAVLVDSTRYSQAEVFERRKRLSVCVGAMAHLMTRAYHTRKVPLGRALYRAGFQEERLVGLLHATGDSLLREITGVGLRLAAAEQSADTADLLRLVFDTRYPYPQRVRSQIAMDYYTRQHAQVSNPEGAEGSEGAGDAEGLNGQVGSEG